MSDAPNVSGVTRYRTVRVVAGLLLAATVGARMAHAQRFEGEVQLRLSGITPGEVPRVMEYATRRGAVRLTIPGAPGGAVAILPTGERTLYMLIPSQQSYMAMPASGALPPTVETPVVKKTGRTEVIAGQTCEHVTVSMVSGTADVCLTTALGPWLNPLSGAGGAAITAWERALGPDGFPLKVTLPDGTVTLEVTRVERKRLPPTLFEIPSSYVKMTMPSRR